MLPLSLLLLSCASGVLAMYEEERAAALADPGPAATDWQPELRLRLSQDALDGMVQAALDEGLLAWKQSVELAGPLGMAAKVVPSGELTSLSLSASDQCDGCMQADAELSGKARWSAAGASGTVPFTARVGATVAFDLARSGSAWQVSGSLRDVDRVKVGSASIGTIDATSLLGDWVEQALKKARPLDLGTVGGDGLPLRAARLSTAGGTLEVQLLTDVPDGSPVSAGGSLAEDFDLRLSTTTALAMARRAAFEQGAIAYEVAAIPTSLQVEGDQFTMGLRLWKLEGAGWWRDYSVTGNASVQRRKIALEPREVVEGEKSRGAGLADPLALLAEGRILTAVEEGMRQALPGTTDARIGERRVTARVSGLRGDGDTLTLHGKLSLGGSPSPAVEGGRTLER